MKKLSLLALFLSTMHLSMAQTARLQVIHNCAATAAATVDVRVNGAFPNASFDNLAFRTATPFITVPAGQNLVVTINLPNSVDSSGSLFRQTFNLTANGTFVVVASGTIGAGTYTPATPFSLQVLSTARETSASGAGFTDIVVLHGATDAPTVDVNAVGAGNLINNISYPQFSSYIGLPVANSNVQVLLANGVNVVQEYQAPLATLNTGGLALTVLASGFLNPGANNSGPGFGLFAATPAGGALIALPPVSTTPARLQVLHNCASPAAGSVDVWLNNTKLLANFAFRTATPFINAPAGTPFDLTIKLPGSTDTLNPVFKVTGLILNSAQRYLAVASGNVGGGFNPARPFSIELFGMARETAVTAGDTTRVLVYHGATDAPAVDVAAVGAGVIVDSIAYSNFRGYLGLPTANYSLQVRPTGSNVVVQQYSAPLSTLSFADSAIVVLASGYLNPAQNNNGPAFGLFVARASGGPFVPLPTQANSPARLQVIHNCAAPAAASVDVWINNSKDVPNFAFRSATPFINAAGGTPFDITIKLPGSTDTLNPLFKITGLVLESGRAYTAIASGTIAGTFSPATPFSIQLYDETREVSDDPAEVDVLVYHGATDAPAVSVSEPNLQATLIPSLSYAQFDPDGYLELPPANYTLRVSAGSTVVGNYQAQLTNLAGSAITVLASGFVNPSANSNGASFGLWVATAAGGPLTQLPIVTGLGNELLEDEISVYPNPATDQLQVQFSKELGLGTSLSIQDLSGRTILKDDLPNSVGGVRTYQVSNLPSGIYLIRITNDKTNITKKLIISN